MTKVNLDAELTGVDGKPIVIDGKSWTVGATLANCVMNGKAENVQDGVAAYMLGEKVRKGGEIELSPEEVTRLHKAIVASQFTILITGQLLILLEAKP